MGRPKRDYAVKRIGIKLTLAVGSDDDLIELLGRVPYRLRAITVKSALRGHAMQWAAHDAEAKQRDESARLVDEMTGFVW
jgi:hypothetical protein